MTKPGCRDRFPAIGNVELLLPLRRIRLQAEEFGTFIKTCNKGWFRMRIAGAILAGGQASRMGFVQKGFLKCPSGASIIRCTVGEMQKSGLEEIIIVANDSAPLLSFGREVIPDIRIGKGPLGGVEAGICYIDDHNLADAVLFIPCDMPGVSHNEISRLLSAFRAAGDGVVMGVGGVDSRNKYPICCVVSVQMRQQITSAVDKGHLKVGRLWEQLNAKKAVFDNPRALCNINTPRDFGLWRKEIG